MVVAVDESKKMDVELTRRGSSITREGEMGESVHQGGGGNRDTYNHWGLRSVAACTT